LKGKVDPGARIVFALFAGTEIEIELRVAELTFTSFVSEALTPAKLKVAVTWALPWLTPSNTPVLLPGALNFATAELSELHATEVLTSWVEESLNVPSAKN
jgi:hypothetical protein